MIITKKRHEELTHNLMELKREFMEYANNTHISLDARLWFNMAMSIEDITSYLSKIQEVK